MSDRCQERVIDHARIVERRCKRVAVLGSYFCRQHQPIDWAARAVAAEFERDEALALLRRLEVMLEIGRCPFCLREHFDSKHHGNCEWVALLAKLPAEKP